MDWYPSTLPRSNMLRGATFPVRILTGRFSKAAPSCITLTWSVYHGAGIVTATGKADDSCWKTR